MSAMPATSWARAGGRAAVAARTWPLPLALASLSAKPLAPALLAAGTPTGGPESDPDGGLETFIETSPE